jgi:hypothetical protein
MLIVNSTLAGNSVTGGSAGGFRSGPGASLGSAVFNRNGSVDIVNSTIARNTSNGYPWLGATVYNLADGAGATATLTLSNSIVAGLFQPVTYGRTTPDVVNDRFNTGAGNIATVIADTPNIVQSGIVTQNGATTIAIGLLNVDPKLAAALANNAGPTQTLLPAFNSPAVEVGTLKGAPAVDQRGLPRNYLMGPIDLGAVQVTQGPSLGDLIGTQWTVGQPGYVGTLPVRSGVKPYSNLSVSGLPPGLSAALDSSTSTITLSGTPTAAGTFTVQVSVADSRGTTDDGTYTITINPPPSITPAALAGATVGVEYNQDITVSNGTVPYTSFTLTAFNDGGTGLNIPTLDPNGMALFDSVPTAAGTATFTVSATDTGGATVSQDYTITVNPALSLALSAGAAGAPYNLSFAIINGTPPYTFTVTGFSDGGTGLAAPTTDPVAGTVTFNSTPTAAGTATFTVSVTDTAGDTLSETLSVPINPAVAISAPALRPQYGSDDNQFFTATQTGYAGPFTFSLQYGAPGLSLAADGRLTGIPTVAGRFLFIVTASGGVGHTSSQSFTLTVSPATLGITADPQTKVYGSADPPLTYVVGGLRFTDTAAAVLTGHLARAPGQTVAGGPYAIGQGSLTANANYIIAFLGSNLTITPATLTVTADAASRYYGLANPTFSDQVSGFVNGDPPTVVSGTPTLSSAATPASAPGGYPIIVDVSPLSAANYTFQPVNGTLTVQPAPLAASGVNVTATAGVPFTGAVATFTNADPFGSAASYAAVITWGDGTSSAGVVSGSGSTLSVSGSHTYALPGDPAVSVQISHDLGYTTTATVGASAAVGQAPSVSVAFGPAGEVVEVVYSNGNLFQFDVAGAHYLGGGVRSASVAFYGGSEVLLLTYQGGVLYQFDAGGTHLLAGGGIGSASLAFGPAGAVYELVDVNDNLTQVDASGAHFIGGGVRSADVAFGPAGEVLVVVSGAGALTQFDAAGAHALGGDVLSAGVAAAPDGTEVLDVIYRNLALYQFDSAGAHLLGPTL